MGWTPTGLPVGSHGSQSWESQWTPTLSTTATGFVVQSQWTPMGPPSAVTVGVPGTELELDWEWTWTPRLLVAQCNVLNLCHHELIHCSYPILVET